MILYTADGYKEVTGVDSPAQFVITDDINSVLVFYSYQNEIDGPVCVIHEAGTLQLSQETYDTVYAMMNEVFDILAPSTE